jgi:hypothetical protein
MFRAHSAHHQERQIAPIQPLVTVILCWWPRCVQVGRTLFWFFLQLLSKTFLILRRIERDMIKNVFWFSCKVPVVVVVVVVRFQWNLNFPNRFWKNAKISWNPINWEPSCCVKTNRQTDRHDEANNGFSQFASQPKNRNPYNECEIYPYKDSSFQGLVPGITALVELKRMTKLCAVMSLLLREVPSIDC